MTQRLGDPGLNKLVLRAARQIATEHKLTVREAFDDTLAGDIARFRLKRLLRNGCDRALLEYAIDEAVTP